MAKHNLTSNFELQRIFDNIPALVGHWDKNLINIFANSGYAQYLDSVPEKIKGLHIKEVLGERIYLLNKRHIENVMQGHPQTFEREKKLPDGRIKSTLIKYLPDILDNQVVGFFVVATDITEVKALEKERRDAEIKLIASAKMSSLGEMASGVAHEINNPLSIIYGKSGQLKRKIQQGQIDPLAIIKDLTKIENMVDRISKIVKGLHSFSRKSDEDPMQMALLSQIFEETLELCQEKFKHHSIQIEFNFHEEIYIECRVSQLSQVFMNLLSNSFDAIENLSERWIKLNVKLSSEKVFIYFIDSGRGIPIDLQDKIMQPFFTTKDIGKGTGLGLSISKGLIENHSGTLTYDPQNQNTCFVISLPVKNTRAVTKPA